MSGVVLACNIWIKTINENAGRRMVNDHFFKILKSIFVTEDFGNDG